MTDVRLAIVGSALPKPGEDPAGWWVRDAQPYVLGIIKRHVAVFRPKLIVSGQSPFGGVDYWAENEAKMQGVDFLGHPARIKQWDGPGGFKERNGWIVRDCTHLLAIRDARKASFGSGWTAMDAVRAGKWVRVFELGPYLSPTRQSPVAAKVTTYFDGRQQTFTCAEIDRSGSPTSIGLGEPEPTQESLL